MSKKYVTEQMLQCIEQNGIYPQDIQNTKNEYITFGSVGLTYTKFTKTGKRTKHLNGYRKMNAAEINKVLNSQHWVIE